MISIRWIEVHEWYHVKPGTRIELGAGVHPVIGASGTGKTMLLELCAMILRSDFSAVAERDHHVEYQLEYRDLGARCVLTVARRFAAGEFAMRVAIEVGERTYVGIQTGDRIRMEHEGRVLASHDLGAADELDPIAWSLIAMAGAGEAELLASVGTVAQILRGHHRTWRVDEGLDVFRSITGRPVAPGRAVSVHLRYPLPPARITRLEASVPGFASVRLGYQAQVRLCAEPGSETLTLEHDELPLCERLVRLIGCQGMRLTLTRTSAREVADGTLYEYGGLRFWFEFAGREQALEHDQMPYAARRLIAVLYALDADPDHLIADELTHGMPHAWVADILAGLADECQAVVSASDPLLFEHLSFPDANGLMQRVVVCERDRGDHMLWRALEPDEAQAMYTALGAGPTALSACMRERAWY